MTQHQEDLELSDEALQEQLLRYLQSHPDFLVQNPEALAAVNIPHPTGDAVSLVERQVRVLREQNQRYRSQLEGLVSVARENDALAKRLHHLTLALIETGGFDEVLNTLQDELRGQFKADAVEMKLFSADELNAHGNETGPAMFNDFLDKQTSSCGRLPAAQLEYLFGEQAGATGSAALIPLQAGSLVGVLAIGSHDPHRFHPGKGVDFLQRLAEIVSAKLNSVSAPGE